MASKKTAPPSSLLPLPAASPREQVNVLALDATHHAVVVGTRMHWLVNGELRASHDVPMGGASHALALPGRPDVRGAHLVAWGACRFGEGFAIWPSHVADDGLVALHLWPATP